MTTDFFGYRNLHLRFTECQLPASKALEIPLTLADVRHKIEIEIDLSVHWTDEDKRVFDTMCKATFPEFTNALFR